MVSNVNEKRTRTIDDDIEQEDEIDNSSLQHKLRKIMKNVSEIHSLQEQQELNTILNDDHEFMIDLIASAKKQAAMSKTSMNVQFIYISPTCESYEFSSSGNTIVKKCFISSKETESLRYIRNLEANDDDTSIIQSLEKKTGCTVRRAPGHRFLIAWYK